MELMQFFGKLMGLAVRHNLPLALDFSAILWRSIAGLSVDRGHLEQVDLLTARNLNDVESVGIALASSSSKGDLKPSAEDDVWRDLVFTTHFSDGTRVQLLPDGDKISVNRDNWQDYVAKVEGCRLQESSTALRLLLDGIGCVLPAEILRLFSGPEVRTLFSSDRKVDIDFLRQNTEYEGLLADSALVTNFWEVLSEMSDEERTQFLRFVWARSRMPASAQELSMKFKLQGEARDNADAYLPHAQTCFFSLTIPLYSSKQILREKLIYAIENSPNMDADVRLHSAEGWDS